MDHDFKKLRSSQSINLCTEYAGRLLLIVNTASHCGFTPQFKSLEALHRRYQVLGLVVVGFPSDDFSQEAKDETREALDTSFPSLTAVTWARMLPCPMHEPRHEPGSDVTSIENDYGLRA